MIRYRNLYESEDAQIRLYDTVKCGNHGWYVISIDGDTVTLLAKDGKDRDFFGNSVFSYSPTNNKYSTSIVRKILNSEVLSKLEGEGINPIPTNLSDVGCTDKVWLLSANEVKKLPKKLRVFISWYMDSPSWWWLRTPSKDYRFAGTVVVDNGDLQDATVQHCLSHRPAIRVHVEDLDY